MVLYLFLALIGLISFWNFYWKRRNFPPGPTPFPIVGNLPQLLGLNRWEAKYIEWAQHYGPTYTYWLGEKPGLAICDYNDMVKLFVKRADIFSDRNHHPTFMKLVRGGSYGIILNNGEVWNEQRRFALKVLRDFGMGKNQMEERILNEIQWIFEKVNKELGAEEMDFFKYTDIAIGSVINSIMYGYRFTDGHEDEFHHVKDLTLRMISTFSNPICHVCLRNPKLLNIPILRNKALLGLELGKEMFAHIDKQIQRHVDENDYEIIDEPNDFIDAFLMEQHRRKKNDEDVGTFSALMLRNVCLDLWAAGQETTSAAITWIIALMITHPEIQRKLHKELDDVIGSKRIIGTADRPGLVYTNAVVMECLRYSNLFAQNFPRVAGEDVVINGYLIKRGTVVVPQISVLLYDPKVFPNPKSLNPERFINADGTLKNIDEFIPFSIGKRACPGEGMARTQLFLLVANLFNQYKFSAGKEAPVLKKVGTTMIEPYKCKVEAR